MERLSQRLWAVRRARDGFLSATALQIPTSGPDKPPDHHRDHSADHSADHGDRPADGDGAEQLQRCRVDDYVSSVQRLREQRDTAAAQQRRLCRWGGEGGRGAVVFLWCHVVVFVLCLCCVDVVLVFCLYGVGVVSGSAYGPAVLMVAVMIIQLP